VGKEREENREPFNALSERDLLARISPRAGRIEREGRIAAAERR